MGHFITTMVRSFYEYDALDLGVALINSPCPRSPIKSPTEIVCSARRFSNAYP